MPATAGRVRMPANNRVHSSAALQTHGIWQSAIGYDPYAPNKDDSKKSSQELSSNVEPEGENAYASFQGLLALARITSSNADEARGACKRCGRVGHLAFQCRNFVSVKDGDKEKDVEAVQAAVLSGLEKIKRNGKRAVESDESEDNGDESETSDSEVDSEIERIIAERSGKKKSGSNRKSSRNKKEGSNDDGSDSDLAGRKKRGRSKKRRSKKRGSSDSEDEDDGKRKRRKEKRRKRDESSDEEDERHRRKRKSRKEKRRRRSHRHSDDSDSDGSEDSGRRHKRKSRKASSLSDHDASGSDGPRVGRDTKRSEKKIRKRRHEDDE